MDCLTERNRSGEATAICCVKGCGNDYSCIGVNRCKGIVNLIDRLADIEDIIKTDYDLSRLRELVQADREGRCVVLPCKRYDTLWTFCDYPKSKVYSFKVTDVSTLNGRTMLNTDVLSVVDARDIGKTVFLTREAAEAALKERENSNV